MKWCVAVVVVLLIGQLEAVPYSRGELLQAIRSLEALTRGKGSHSAQVRSSEEIADVDEDPFPDPIDVGDIVPEEGAECQMSEQGRSHMVRVMLLEPIAVTLSDALEDIEGILSGHTNNGVGFGVGGTPTDNKGGKGGIHVRAPSEKNKGQGIGVGGNPNGQENKPEETPVGDGGHGGIHVRGYRYKRNTDKAVERLEEVAAKISAVNTQIPAVVTLLGMVGQSGGGGGGGGGGGIRV